ncbi:DUF6992 family protein [Fibrella forsythiae]|uniref:Uncharacterized protein n=1 Tax=Fibrella forsythiae TaxID=2817061 RepID=A0ABS3JDP9_9BACT|nr:hypothetical protein [Fibrella forsythiae]MBO0947581.1 hypothetical protein [Fibrella forsythiae]
MSRISSILYTLSATLIGQLCQSQALPVSPAERLQFSQERYNHTRTLGLSLGGYALANLAVSGIAIGQSTGETKYIHQMNLYWNAVNLGIAGLGLLGLRKQHPETETLGEAVQKHNSMKQTLLFNAGLDVAYIAGGLYLTERANSHPDQADKLRGYGKAVMAQGAFLLAFDVVNYLVFRRRGDPQQVQLIGQAPMGVGVSIPIR